MPDSTTPQLSEAEVAAIAQKKAFQYGTMVSLTVAERDALIRDWRALRARIEELTTEWCRCGHAKNKHSFFADHDEC